MGRGVGVTRSLNSPAWECCELHVANGRAQSSGQKAEKQYGRVTTVDFYEPQSQNKAEPPPSNPNPKGHYFYIL